MEFLKLSDLRKSPMQHFRRLEAGEELIVVSRGEVLARMTGVGDANPDELAELMERMGWPTDLPEGSDRYEIAREMERRGSRHIG